MKRTSLSPWPRPRTRADARFFALLCLALLASLAMGAQQARAKVRKAVFVIVDGIAADVIERQPTPSIDAIAKIGGYTRAFVGGERGGYSQTPTISAVGYNSILTGTWANKHNVWGNDIQAPNYSYPTIFRLFKTSYPGRKTAIFSSWLDNRTKMVGDNLPATGGIPVDIHFDGLELDTARFPHDEEKRYMSAIDDSVAGAAARSIRTQAPDLSWVYLEHTDDVGHRHGDSPQLSQAVALADGRVGEIWRAIQFRQQRFGEDWLLIVTTDHGRDAATGKGHGGQSERERSSWICTNAQGLNAAFAAPQASIVDIMPTLARFLGVQMPIKQQAELDGAPLIGKISILSAKAQHDQGNQGDRNTLRVSWRAVEKKGRVKVWLSRTNRARSGGSDSYQLIGEVPVAQQSATIRVGGQPLGFAKIVLQAPHNTLNRWIVDTPASTP